MPKKLQPSEGDLCQVCGEHRQRHWGFHQERDEWWPQGWITGHRSGICCTHWRYVMWYTLQLYFFEVPDFSNFVTNDSNFKNQSNVCKWNKMYAKGLFKVAVCRQAIFMSYLRFWWPITCSTSCIYVFQWEQPKTLLFSMQSAYTKPWRDQEQMRPPSPEC